ncbi:hypothetical protein CRG98_005076 [Punica granatum]|uniref:Uncharacterized protein n=1 Tax=Punica granatum TaxID=22663 RepID=A0A2I0L1E4_PUNGR|nr:hypothetical protein CRG98_005076 [Punica granatum]
MTPLVSHTSCGLEIPKGSGQVIYFNTIPDRRSNTIQPSKRESSSCTDHRCADPNFNLVEVRMHALWRNLGVSTFPWGRVTDTREKESPLHIYDPKVKGRKTGDRYKSVKDHPERVFRIVFEDLTDVMKRRILEIGSDGSGRVLDQVQQTRLEETTRKEGARWSEWFERLLRAGEGALGSRRLFKAAGSGVRVRELRGESGASERCGVELKVDSVEEGKRADVREREGAGGQRTSWELGKSVSVEGES